jgi:hypothetical protein
LRDHPEGLALHELEKRLAQIASRRSLQRLLRAWHSKGAVRVAGVRRARRYFSPHPAIAAQHDAMVAEPSANESVPLSEVGQEIRALVRRSIADRAPVGYGRDFLESYNPNTTHYLSEPLRRHLHELGRTPDGERPAGTYARDILNRLLIDLSWSSSRLEGNTYSLLDTEQLIQHGIPARDKDAKETRMILNHKAAIELLVESAEEVGVNRYTITNLHALLADNLLGVPAHAGRLRETPIAISGSLTYQQRFRN